MLALIENLKEVNELPKFALRKESGINKGLMSNLNQKVNGIYPNAVGDGKGNGISLVSDQTHCYDEWAEIVKLLRIAEENIRHVIFTNSYTEERVMKYYEDVKDMRLKSTVFADKLNELKKIDMEFTRIVSDFMSRYKVADKKKVFLQNLAKKSKSVEYSEHKMCPGGLILKQFHALPRKEKLRRKKDYGKYCPTCGAVEVPSQSSMIRCQHCYGEIIVQGQCSSCDSFQIHTKFNKFSEELERNSHYSSKFPKKQILVNDRNMKSWTEDWFFYRENHQKNYEISYCSDCEFTSSCDISAKVDKKKLNASVDSLLPLSDSENQGIKSYSHDFDISSSVSSSDDAAAEKFKLVPMASFIKPSDFSLHEEYATPREHLSTEDIKNIEIDSDPPFETTVAEFSGEEIIMRRMGLDERTQSPNPSDSHKMARLDPMVQQPEFDKICDRLHHAEKALGNLKSENLKLEEGILIMENISHQNLKLSLTLRDIAMKITNSLKVTQKTNIAAADENESLDDFKEALDDLTDAESYFDTQSTSTYHSCLEHKVAVSCLSDKRCYDKNQADFSKSSLEKEMAEESSQSNEKAIVPAQTIGRSLILNDNLSTYPTLFTGDWSYPSSTSVEDRLKFIEREATLLKDNNQIINLFVDDFRAKLQTELDYVQTVCTRKTNTSETKIVEFDVSFYQFTEQIAERKMKEETMMKNPEEKEEEICQKGKTFLEMKFEEVYKKEEQTAMELEIFEERLEVEGLIIKEKESFFTCSNFAEAMEDQNLQAIEWPHTLASGRNLFSTLTDQNYQNIKEFLLIAEKLPKSMRDKENNNLCISIEIEVEKDKNSKRCEYKRNLQKRKFDQDKRIPSITLCPVWASHRSAVTHNGGGSTKVSVSEFGNEKPFFIDIGRDEFIEIKPPNFFTGSSEDEGEELGSGGELVRANAASYVPMPFAIYPVTEITLSERPFAVLNTVNKKKEFSRISQIELSQSPESGVVFLQTKAVSSLSVISCHEDDSQEEFFEAISSDTSCNEKINYGILRRDMELKSLVHFTPINVGKCSVLTITCTGETLPLVVNDEILPVIRTESIPDYIPELKTALSLIREIENEVVEVKLDNAIAILPQLESVLREHIQSKTKVLKATSSVVSNTSLDMFLSALSFIVADGQKNERKVPETDSYERLGRMLKLLMELEEAVKDMSATDYEKTDCNKSGRIYDLVQDLSTRVEKIGSDLDVPAMEKTFELTSELDDAVRDYSSCLLSENIRSSESEKERISDCTITADTLNLIKKKIFDIVTFEALERDMRIEENVERIQTLEKENFEVMRFLDTLLDKTLKRAGELDQVRDIAVLLRSKIQKLMRTPVESPLLRTSGTRIAKVPSLPSIQEVSSDCRSSGEEESVRQTLSDMIIALDTLKIKAKQKTDKCREIFGNPVPIHHSVAYADESDVKNSILCEINSEEEKKTSQITQFSRIGANSFFITWSKPTQVDGESQIVGYEIWVNGRVNQRVRNPERLKAVLYSVSPSSSNSKFRIKLFALTEDGRRLSLADFRYPEEEDADPFNIIT